MFNVPSQPDAILDVPKHSRLANERTTSSEAILGLLSLGPMSGYELQRTIARTIGNFWQESFGQIYPALRKLLAQGWARIEPREESGSARVSKVYRLTDTGRDRLRVWLGMPCGRQVVRDELLLKIFCGDSAPPDALLRHLRAHKAMWEVNLERYRAAEARLPEAQRGSSNLPYFLICVHHGLARAKAELRWCEESIAVLVSLQAHARGERSAEPRNESEPAMSV